MWLSHSHLFRLFPYSLREERLLGFKPPPREESPEKYRHELQSLLEAVPFTKDQLRDYERRMKAGEASSLLHILSERALGTPGAERCRVLAESLNARQEMAEEVQRIEQDVLEKMIGEEKKDVLPERKQAPEVSPSPRKTPFVPPKKADVPKGPVPAVKVEPAEKKESILDRVGWKKLSPETRKNIQAAGVGLGVATGAFLLWKLIKRTKRGVQNGVEQTKKGMNWLGRKFVVGGLFALSAVAGFLGYKAFERYYGSLAKLKDNLASAQRNLDLVSGALRDAAALSEGRRAELLHQRDLFLKQKEELEKRIEEAKKNPKQETVSLAEGQREEPKKPDVREQEKRMAGDIAKKGGYAFLARSLISLQKNPTWDVPSETKTLHLRDFLSNNEERPMSEIFQCLKDDGSVDASLLRMPDRSKESREYAARVVVEYCRLQTEHLRKTGRTEEDVQALSLREFLKLAVPGHAVLDSIQAGLESHNGDFVKALKSGEYLKEAETMLHAELQDFQQEHASTLQSLDTSEMLQLLELATSFDISVVAFLEETQDAADPSILLLREICKELQKDTPQYMLPFFHSLFPTEKEEDATGEQEKDLAYMQRLLLSEMTLFEAMRFYLYRRILGKQNPAGVALMQAEVFNYVSDHDQSALGNLEHRLAKRIADVAVGGVWKEWNNVDVQIDPSLIDASLRQLKIVGKGAFFAVLGGMLETTKQVGKTWGAGMQEEPLWVGVPTFLGGSFLLYRRYLKHQRYASPFSVEHRLQQMTSNRAAHMALMREAAALTHSYESAEVASALFKRMQEDLDKLLVHKGTRAVGLDLKKMLRKCTTASIKDSSTVWNEFLVLARNHQAASPLVRQIADAAEEICTNKGVHNALKFASRPTLGRVRWLGKKVSFPLRKGGSVALQAGHALARKTPEALGKAARTLKVPKLGHTVPILGDVAGLVFAGVEAKQTWDLIRNTPEGELKELYRNRYRLLGAELVVSSSGLLGMATIVLPTMGGTVGWMTLPATAFVLGAIEGQKYAEDLTHSARDWKREYSKSELESFFMNDSTALSNVMGRVGLGVMALGTGIEWEKAEAGKREEILRALFMHMTNIAVPISENGQITPEAHAQAKELSRQFINAKVECVRRLTNGSFDIHKKKVNEYSFAGLMRGAEAYAKAKLFENRTEIDLKELPHLIEKQEGSEWRGIYQEARGVLREMFLDEQLHRTEGMKGLSYVRELIRAKAHEQLLYDIEELHLAIKDTSWGRDFLQPYSKKKELEMRLTRELPRRLEEGIERMVFIQNATLMVWDLPTLNLSPIQPQHPEDASILLLTETEEERQNVAKQHDIELTESNSRMRFALSESEMSPELTAEITIAEEERFVKECQRLVREARETLIFGRPLEK